jgi:hypothetical protein
MRRNLLGLTIASIFVLLVGIVNAQKQPNNNIIPATAALCDSIPNAVTNCAFGTGDFTGWTLSGDTSFTGVTGCGRPGGSPNCAFLGPTGHLGLMTQIVFPSAGTKSLSFWMSSSGQPSEFEVWYNGKVHEVKTIPDHSYTQYTISVTASGSGDDLTFAFYNLPSFIDLTDIVVTP